MSLLWIEGFETFGTVNGDAPVGYLEKYVVDSATTTGVTIQDGRVGGKSLRLGSNARTFTVPAFGNKTTIVVGFGLKVASFAITQTILTLFDGSTNHINIRLVATSGEFEIRRSGTTLATTSGAALTPNVWGYVELKVTIDDSTGSYELRVNGVNEASASGVDTRNAGNASVDRVQFAGSASASSNVYFDDIYILDTSGSLNNDFLGSQKVVAIYPSAAGDSTQFAPSAGNNYQAVDDNPPDDDSTYVESGTSSQLDLYNFDDTSLVGVKGVQINARCKETDGTPFSVHLVAKSGATQSDGSAIAVGSTNYLTRTRIVETDPDTSAAWTDGGIDSAQFGVKVA